MAGSMAEQHRLFFRDVTSWFEALSMLHPGGGGEPVARVALHRSALFFRTPRTPLRVLSPADRVAPAPDVGLACAMGWMAAHMPGAHTSTSACTKFNSTPRAGCCSLRSGVAAILHEACSRLAWGAHGCVFSRAGQLFRQGGRCGTHGEGPEQEWLIRILFI